MKHTVLLVDDASFMRMTLKKILENDDFIVVGEAENGQMAIHMYKEMKPDVVVMDITMPEMSGAEALKQIRSIDPNAKVVMCSAMGQQHMVVDAIQSGAKDFIVKPFQADRVVEALKRALV